MVFVIEDTKETAIDFSVKSIKILLCFNIMLIQNDSV